MSLNNIVIANTCIRQITKILHEINYPIELGNLYAKSANHKLFDQILKICDKSIKIDFNPDLDLTIQTKKLEIKFKDIQNTVLCSGAPTNDELKRFKAIELELNFIRDQFNTARFKADDLYT
nr:hypothetical protein [Abalone asfa-like virus]